MKKPLFKSKTILWSSYFILVAAIGLIAILLVNFNSAHASIREVTFSRTGTAVTATATPNSGYQLKFLTNTSSEQYWQYSQVSNASSCNSQGFGTAQEALKQTASSVNFTVSGIQSVGDYYFCLKVLYGLTNNVSSWLEHYALFVYDQTAPTVTLVQNGLKVQATATDTNAISSWQSAVGDITICNDGVSYSNDQRADSTNANKATLTLVAANDDLEVCFAATDAQGNVGYSTPLTVDTTVPRLSISQNNSLLTINVTQTDNTNTLEANTDINLSSWRYAIVSSANVCQNQNINWKKLSTVSGDISKNSATLNLNSSASNRHYCFQVADTAKNVGHAHIQIATINAAPTIRNLRQSLSKVYASGYDSQYLDKDSWQFAVTAASTATDYCRSISSSLWQSNGLVVQSSSSTTSSSIEIDLSLLYIDESTTNQGICLRVIDNLAGNYGYGFIDVDATPPTITIKQDNTALTASAANGDRAQSSTWAYVRHSSQFVCNKNAFDTYTPAVRSHRLTLQASDVGDYFCFRVADQYNNYGFSQIYNVLSLDTSGPTIKFKQDNHLLTVSATFTTLDYTWGYAKTSKTTKPTNCDATYSYLSINNLQITLSEADNDYWFCVRVANTSNVYKYQSVQVKDVDTVKPVVSIRQYKTILIASSTATDLKADSWQYAVSAVGQDFSCDANLEFNQAAVGNNQVVLTSADTGRFYCFKVSDKTNNVGYGKSAQIGTIDAAPVIRVVQNSNLKRLEVSTADNDVNGLTWGWAVFDTDPGECRLATGYTTVTHDQITSDAKKILVRDIVDTQNGKYYCFRVADTSTIHGVNYGYTKHRYDLSGPTIQFSLDAQTNILTVSSTASDLVSTSWRYAKFAQKPDCTSVNIAHVLPPQGRIQLQASDENHWLCFRVSDTKGNHSYASYLVQILASSQVPVIETTQTPYVLIATSASTNLDSSSWRYALAPSQVYCGANNQLTFTRNTTALNKVDLTTLPTAYNWVCFKVSNTRNQTGYLLVKIDRQAPEISIMQNNVALEISSSATDLADNTWAYARSQQDFDCQTAEFTELNFTSKKISINLTSSDSNTYYCIRVADTIGNKSYKKIRITPLTLDAPVIKIQQPRATLVKASAKDIQASSWQYVRSSRDLNCSTDGESQLSFNRASASNAQIRVSEADNGFWFCFKVLGNNQVAGYAKVLVSGIDSKAPSINVRQNNQTVIAQANEEVVKWQYVALTSANNQCNKSAFSDEARVQTGKQFVATTSDDQVVYCFRAVDAAGNVAYSAFTVSVDTPQPTTTTAPTTTTTVTPDGDTNNQTPTDEGMTTEDYTLWWIAGGALAIIVIVTTIFIVSNKRDNNGPFDDDYIQ